MSKASKHIINLALRNEYKGMYSVAIRYFKGGEEKYIQTEFKISKEDWNAPAPKRGEGSQGFQAAEAIRNQLRPKVRAALLKCGVKEVNGVYDFNGVAFTFEMFKTVLEGKSLNNERTWTALLDKHIQINQHPDSPDDERYVTGTLQLYQYTRSILLDLEKAGKDMAVENFKEVEDYKRLEGWIRDTPYFDKKTGVSTTRKMGRTVLAMHMQNIKAIAKTGYTAGKGLRWISTNAFSEYKKPKRSAVGTDPNTAEDYLRIRDFSLDLIPVVPHTGSTALAKQHTAYKEGRDFWCFMVTCGGMEARNIAELRWPDVRPDHFRFIRTKTKKDSSDYTVMDMDDPFIQYIFEEYGVKENKRTDSYVFSILSEDMSDTQKESAIQRFYSKISEYVRKIGKILQINPLPNCKRTRPTFAVTAVNSGFDIMEIKNMMSHKNVKTTDVYVKNLPTQTKLSVSKRFATALNGAPAEAKRVA